MQAYVQKSVPMTQHTVNTSPTPSSSQYTTPSTRHLHLVPTRTPHRQHVAYSWFQPGHHTVNTSPTATSNQYTTPSTCRLQLVPTRTPHRQHVAYSWFQPVQHTVNTSLTRWITTHHINASSITQHRLNNFNSQVYNTL